MSNIPVDLNGSNTETVAATPTTSATRVAVVTGAAQGIGREIAIRLAVDGYDVALNDIPSNSANLEAVREKILATGPTRRCVLCTGDVSEEEDVIALVERTVSELGSLDVMVANAGIVRISELVETSMEHFDRIIAINVRGTMMCYKYAAIQMIKQGKGGRIIGAASIAGKSGSPYLSAYGASKFAIRGLTQCTAIELGRHGITVNAYAPGPVLTNMMDDYDERVTQKEDRAKGDLLRELRDRSALGRVAAPADIANLVSYLVSPAANFITGQSIIVDGGINFD